MAFVTKIRNGYSEVFFCCPFLIYLCSSWFIHRQDRLKSDPGNLAAISNRNMFAILKLSGYWILLLILQLGYHFHATQPLKNMKIVVCYGPKIPRSSGQISRSNIENPRQWQTNCSTKGQPFYNYVYIFCM